MVHKGEIIEKAVRRSGISITELSKRIGISRRHIYNVFNNPDINWEIIVQIGKVIHYDFSKDFVELETFPENKKILHEDIPTPFDNNPIYWKNKYLILLEEYNSLLKDFVSKFLKKG